MRRESSVGICSEGIICVGTWKTTEGAQAGHVTLGVRAVDWAPSAHFIASGHFALGKQRLTHVFVFLIQALHESLKLLNK